MRKIGDVLSYEKVRKKDNLYIRAAPVEVKSVK
jgi:hypothetical protein